MLIYSVHLTLDRDQTIDNLLSLAAMWLTRRSNQTIRPADLRKGNVSLQLGDGSKLRAIRSEGSPELFALRLQYADGKISGRQWTVELGFRRAAEGADIECSCLVSTAEHSVRVGNGQAVVPVRPGIVTELQKFGHPTERTIGREIKTLESLREAETLLDEIESQERDYPIVLVSPDCEGDYLIDVDRLHGLLFGIAQIILIPPTINSWALERVLGKRYTAFNGAVNILSIPDPHHRQPYCDRLVSEQIDSLPQAEVELFSRVIHRTNLPFAKQHIGFNSVEESLRWGELQRLKASIRNADDINEYVRLLEQENAELSEKTSQAREMLDQIAFELAVREEELMNAQERNRELMSKADTLRWSMQQVRRSRDDQAGAPCPQLAEAFANLMAGCPTPEDSLRLLEGLYPDRLVVLETAWESAAELRTFREKAKLYDLLWKLVNDYRQALIDGKGDAEARLVFGKINAFSACESESVESNRRARQLRTFWYKDQELYCGAHLKIGNQEGGDTTIRVHFAWDAEDQKIVIGWCGRHLDHK